jgi:hypothetical protein
MSNEDGEGTVKENGDRNTLKEFKGKQSLY